MAACRGVGAAHALSDGEVSMRPIESSSEKRSRLPFSWRVALAAAVAVLAPGISQAVPYTLSTQTGVPLSPLPLNGGTATNVPFSSIPADDLGARVTFPGSFTYKFYEQTYGAVTVSSNGFLTFEPTSDGTARATRTFPSTTAPTDILAVWLADSKCWVNDSVKWQMIGSAPARQVVIEWKCSKYDFSTQFPTWQAQVWLTEGSSTLRVHYGTFNTPSDFSAVTVGVQKGDRTEWTYGLPCTSSCPGTSWPADTVITYSQGPELQVTNVLAPIETFAGISFPVTATVRNTGGAPAIDFTIQLWLNTTPSKTGAIPLGAPAPDRQTMNPGNSVNFSLRPTIPLSVNQGTYYVIAEADPDHVVPVSGRGSTIGSSPAISVGIPAPNLIAIEVEAPAEIQPGKTFDLAWTASNIGNAPAYHVPYQVVLASSDTPSASSRILDIMGSDGRPTSRRHVDVAEMIDPPVANRVYANVPMLERVILPADVPAGRYWIGVRMDPDGEVFEHERSNNIGVSNSTVAKSPTSLGITTASTLPSAEIASDYAVALQAVGGDGSYFWKLAPGAVLPPGFHLEELPAGARDAGLPFVTYLSGTPTRIGEYEFTLEVSSGALTKASTFHLSVVPQMLALTIQTRELRPASFDKDYYFKLVADGGLPPYAWSIASGKLPGGLRFGTDGVIEGRPLQSGEFPLTFRVTDDRGVSATQAMTLTVLDPDGIRCGTDSIGPFRLGESVDVFLQAGGGLDQEWTNNATYYLSSVEGEDTKSVEKSSPPGLSLESTGRVRGKPTRAGAYDWTVDVRESLKSTPTTCMIRLEVLRDRNLAISTQDLTTAVVGGRYNAQLEASGGEGDLQWSLLYKTEKLPAGLTLTSDGLITGVPTGEDLAGEKAGNFSFLVRVVDSYNRVGTAPMSIMLLASPPGSGPADDKKEESTCQTVGADPSLLAVAAALGLAALRRRSRP